MPNKSKRIVYYRDPVNDDFAGTKINTRKIDPHYRYVHKNLVWRCLAGITYFVVRPIVYLIEYGWLGVRVKNKKALRKVKGGCFLYGNHTGFFDAYTPCVLSGRKVNRILVNPDAVSIKGIRTLVQWLGAVPVPDDIASMRNMVKAVEYYHEKGDNITIYPEAHIWPYYTGVRPFSAASFYYPVKTNAPVFAFFTAYSQPTGIFRKLKKANLTGYVSEPFYPDPEKSLKAAQQELRDQVYNFMCRMAEKHSTYQVIEYRQAE